MTLNEYNKRLEAINSMNYPKREFLKKVGDLQTEYVCEKFHISPKKPVRIITYRNGYKTDENRMQITSMNFSLINKRSFYITARKLSSNNKPYGKIEFFSIYSLKEEEVRYASENQNFPLHCLEQS